MSEYAYHHSSLRTTVLMLMLVLFPARYKDAMIYRYHSECMLIAKSRNKFCDEPEDEHPDDDSSNINRYAYFYLYNPFVADLRW